MASRHALGAIAPQDRAAARTLTVQALPPIRSHPFSYAGPPPMKLLLSATLLSAAAVIAVPALAQTSPTQGWPQNRPADQSAPPAAKPPQAAPKPPTAAQKPGAAAPAAPAAQN